MLRALRAYFTALQCLPRSEVILQLAQVLDLAHKNVKRRKHQQNNVARAKTLVGIVKIISAFENKKRKQLNVNVLYTCIIFFRTSKF